MEVPKLRFKDFTSEWERNKLADLVSFSKGKNISKNDIHPDGTYECIRYGELYTDYNEVVQVIKSKTNLNKSLLVFSHKNDIIIPSSGETREDIATASCVMMDGVALGGDLNILRGKENGVFLSYYLNSQKKREISQMAQGNSVVHLYSKELANLEILKPTLQEQQKIAGFLTSVDDKINLLKKKKELLEQYKKGVMQKIFSQELRFKDEDGKDFPEWEEKKIKECFTITRGNVLSMTQLSGHAGDNIYPVFSSQTKNKGLAGFYHKFLFQDAITWTTDGANAGEVNFRKGKFYCTNVCGVLLSEKGEANPAIAAILNSVAKRYVSYVGNPKLMNNVMAQIKINVPTSLLEQKKIARFLTALDEKIALVEQQINQTELWKKGLLQQMFV